MTDYTVRIQREYVADDGWECDLGELPLGVAWYEVSLPVCPDCGGDMVWSEDGFVPGTRMCMGRPISENELGVRYLEAGGCGSLFSVQTRDGRVFVQRLRFY